MFCEHRVIGDSHYPSQRIQPSFLHNAPYCPTDSIPKFPLLKPCPDSHRQLLSYYDFSQALEPVEAHRLSDWTATTWKFLVLAPLPTTVGFPLHSTRRCKFDKTGVCVGNIAPLPRLPCSLQMYSLMFSHRAVDQYTIRFLPTLTGSPLLQRDPHVGGLALKRLLSPQATRAKDRATVEQTSSLPHAPFIDTNRQLEHIRSQGGLHRL